MLQGESESLPRDDRPGPARAASYATRIKAEPVPPRHGVPHPQTAPRTWAPTLPKALEHDGPSLVDDVVMESPVPIP